MIDYKLARSRYDEKTGLFVPNGDNGGAFAAFSPAYLVSNEDLRSAMNMLQPHGVDVLTVAGSGDQPIFYKLYGANNVDTFDISYAAKVMMDVKTAAIQKLNSGQYRQMLDGINAARGIADVPEYKTIQSICPVDSQEFIRKMHGVEYYLRGGLWPDSAPFASEYDVLKKSVNGNFNFIWTDLDNLAGRLNKKYDQMYLSNILQYGCSVRRVSRIVNDLADCLKPHGQIMLQVSPYFIWDELCVYEQLGRAVSKWANVRMVQSKTQCMCILRKL